MSDNVNNGGVGLGGLLFVLFLALKLIGVEPVAHWSWWWVTAPLWIPWGIFMVFAAVAGLIALAVALLSD